MQVSEQSNSLSQSPSKTQTPSKTDKQMKKQKRKKTMALQSFLNQNKSEQINTPLRTTKNPSDVQDAIQQQNTATTCTVCNRDMIQKKKYCGFCKGLACSQHMRKKRKLPNSSKFGRICDDCQDKQLFQKYMKVQIKAQESLQMQQLIIQSKHQELKDIVNGKKTKVTLLMNKKGLIEEQKKFNLGKFVSIQNDLRNKDRKLESKNIQIDNLKKIILELETNIPRSLEDDYQALTQQNAKITKQLVKYEKLCQEAIKAKSKKQKQMYEEYYSWQQRQKQKNALQQKTKEQCEIF